MNFLTKLICSAFILALKDWGYEEDSKKRRQEQKKRNNIGRRPGQTQQEYKEYLKKKHKEK